MVCTPLLIVKLSTISSTSAEESSLSTKSTCCCRNVMCTQSPSIFHASKCCNDLHIWESHVSCASLGWLQICCKGEACPLKEGWHALFIHNNVLCTQSPSIFSLKHRCVAVTTTLGNHISQEQTRDNCTSAKEKSVLLKKVALLYVMCTQWPSSSPASKYWESFSICWHDEQPGVTTIRHTL